MFENRKYLIVKSSEMDKATLEQLITISRESSDKTKFVIKWDDEEPSFVSNLTHSEGPYDQEQILDILAGAEWQGLRLPGAPLVSE